MTKITPSVIEARMGVKSIANSRSVDISSSGRRRQKGINMKQAIGRSASRSVIFDLDFATGEVCGV